MKCSVCSIKVDEKDMKWIREKNYVHFMKVCGNCAA